IQRNQSAAFSSGKVRPNHETNINIIARRTGKDVNSHTVLDGIITTIMATIQRINIIGSREGSRNRRRLKANQTGKKFNCRGFGPLLEDKLCLIFKLAPSVCRMTFPILASLLVRLVVLLPFQL